MTKHNIVISRWWNRPKIDVFVMDEGIAIQLSVADFVKAIAAEVKRPWFYFGRKSFEKKIVEAAIEVLEKTKQVTSEV